VFTSLLGLVIVSHLSPRGLGTLQPQLKMMDRFHKKRHVIKGEHKKNKLWRKKNHGSLQLKSEQRSNDITPLTRFWVT
jgi:hypothetical protein